MRITQALLLGNIPRTRGQFRKFVEDAVQDRCGKGGRGFGWDSEKEERAGFTRTFLGKILVFADRQHPVVNVSWNDATAFCKWLSYKEGKTYRLPTEAEWNMPAGRERRRDITAGMVRRLWPRLATWLMPHSRPSFRIGTKRSASDGHVFTSPVGKFRPNAFGFYDMHGNASQWCADWYGKKYYAASPPADPKGPETGRERSLSGWLLVLRRMRPPLCRTPVPSHGFSGEHDRFPRCCGMQ